MPRRCRRALLLRDLTTERSPVVASSASSRSGRGRVFGGWQQMDLVKIDAIEIKVVAWDPRASLPVAEEWLEVPPAVGPDNVEAYLLGRFGQPCGVDSRRPDGGPTGWYFQGDQLATLGLPGGDLQLLAVPFVRFPGGRRLELSEYHAALGRHFRDLVASLDPAIGCLGTAPAELAGRLDEEHLSIASTDESDIELQVGGWLRRMITEGHTYLVIDLPDSGRYVQFVTEQGDWLRAEAVGDRYLGGHPPLADAERAVLAELGWNEPDDDEEDGGNFWLEWSVSDDGFDPLDAARHPVSWEDATPDDTLLGDDAVADAARLAATTLCQAFGPLELAALVTQTGPVQID